MGGSGGREGGEGWGDMVLVGMDGLREIRYGHGRDLAWRFRYGLGVWAYMNGVLRLEKALVGSEMGMGGCMLMEHIDGRLYLSQKRTVVLVPHKMRHVIFLQYALWFCYSIRCEHIINPHRSRQNNGILTMRLQTFSIVIANPHNQNNVLSIIYDDSPLHPPKIPLLNRRPHNPISPHNIRRTN